MYTVAIANQKGGVGKTTTAAALAQGLTEAGYSVLCVDADSQANLSDMLHAEPGASLYDVIKGTPARKAIQTTTAGDLIQGEKALSSLSIEAILKDDITKIQKALRPLRSSYDVAIIDTSPGLGALTFSAFKAADGVIVPTRPDKFSLTGLQELYTSAKTLKPNLDLIGVVVTQYNGRATLNKAILQALQQQAEIYHSRVIEPPIRRTVAAEELQYTGVESFYTDNSTAAQDYAAIVAQIPALIHLRKEDE